MDMLANLKQSLIWLKQALAWSVGFSALVVPPSLLTVYYAEPSRLSFLEAEAAEPTTPVMQAPLEVTAAADACQVESQERLSDRLLRSNVDWHSTRFQPDRNIFVVVLQADVGQLRDFEQANIYCYVSPRSRQVSYFNAYDSKGKSYISGASSFVGTMMAFRTVKNAR